MAKGNGKSSPSEIAAGVPMTDAHAEAEAGLRAARLLREEIVARVVVVNARRYTGRVWDDGGAQIDRDALELHAELIACETEITRLRAVAMPAREERAVRVQKALKPFQRELAKKCLQDALTFKASAAALLASADVVVGAGAHWSSGGHDFGLGVRLEGIETYCQNIIEGRQ